MNVWGLIALAGIGTYLMRSVGVWAQPQFLQGRWLNHLPFAVILVIAVNSLASFTQTGQGAIAAVLATAAVVAASLRGLPLIVCIAVGCAAYGLLAGA